MTIEEAKFINERAFLVDACGDTDEYLIEANHMAVKALERQDKYRWHDLRKDASDLPEDDERVIFYTVMFNEECEFRYWTGNFLKYCKTFYNDDYEGYATNYGYEADKVIAWKYIEPFEEEKLC